MWLLSSRKTRRSSPARSHRPCVEALEDRCLLSAGSLDPTFGNGAGYVTTSTTPYTDGARVALIQPNGDIVAVGNASTSAGLQFGVERYNPNGSLDTSFGSGGVAQAIFGNYQATGWSGALYPAGTANAGEIVEVGQYNEQYQVLARFNTNGTLDTTFGTNGEVMTAFPGMPDYLGGGVVVTSAGQIVAFTPGSPFVLARYNANGSLDTSFGQGGYVITNISDSNNPLLATVHSLANGDLLVVCTQGPNGSQGVWDIYCFTPSGKLDTSFGNQGIVTTTAPGGPETAVIYPDAGTTNDGQIVLVGQASNGLLELIRYNANGSLDTTFGNGGFMQTQFNIGPGNQAALDADGRIVVTGTDGSAAAVARFNINGTPDTTFGNGGLVTTTVGTSSIGQGIAIYPNAGSATDGDIVVVGKSDNGTKYNVLVARYLAQATSPYFVITGSSSLTAGTAGTFTISVLNLNGSVDTGYSGTVHITSTDPQAVLPAGFTITGGTGTFNATFKTAGVQSLTAMDTVTASINGISPGITVNPAAATHFVVSGPSSIAKGTAFDLTVTVEDAYGNVVTGYTGTVTFTSSDGSAVLPENYTFTAADKGVYTFTKLKLKTKGTQTITLTDTSDSLIIGSFTTSVT